jgi:hypothetical protein
MNARSLFFAAACGLTLLACTPWGIAQAADAPSRKANAG